MQFHKKLELYEYDIVIIKKIYLEPKIKILLDFWWKFIFKKTKRMRNIYSLSVKSEIIQKLLEWKFIDKKALIFTKQLFHKFQRYENAYLFMKISKFTNISAIY